MINMNRRKFLQTMTTAVAACTFSAKPPFLLSQESRGAERPGRRFTANLNVGHIGVKATPLEAIKLARQYDYESVAPMLSAMLKYSQAELQQLAAEMKSNNIVWGAGALRPFVHPDDAKFKQNLTEILQTAQLCQRLGVTRCFTWTGPSSDTMTYLENFRLHVRRLRETGKILADYGVRLGIEYVGTRMSAIRGKFPFVRTSAETKELASEAGLTNIGLALDSWHWFQAGETEDDIRKLSNQDVVNVHICDAPAGMPREQMPDSPRRLPCATGVIDLRAFLQGLVKIGYDGPVETEPFDKSLNKMSTEEALEANTAAIKKAFALI